MAAPQIPNLNTLRRGRGRGRGGSQRTEEGPGRTSGKDRVIQGTDNDASVSRLSAVRLGYLDDPYAEALTPAENAVRRFPIINRGTYVRTTAIDELVTRFLGPYTPQSVPKRKQIISLGAGSDTRVFRLLASRQPPDVIYHEIDFAVNTTAKIKAIRSTPLLQRAVGITPSNDEVSLSETGDALHSPCYHIHPLDLRSLSATEDPSKIMPGFKTELPTLLVSECCLVYLSPTEAEQVLSWFTKALGKGADVTGTANIETPITPLGLILYEPIRPDDPFGRTMVANLATRGIKLQTLQKYHSLGAQRTRLKEQGFISTQAAADIEFIWEHWVNEQEKERVADIERLDEMEEWQLLARHYCIAWGWRNGIDPTAFSGWSTLPSQSSEQ
ncbi:hypothetical protein N7468_002930 [Penicillium chermesinum]|uniref:Leucine carboxyl methyltransferase 1 n=1 Tax=Penicillium chermesinum TaxID=63820 RepID=A0A9W9TR52_9EURO|nr:uncharacterized protein N7468_002930 [Penicillium chermesinum]KAJ5238311.1 hypothetical protein N7468_002930 [Penicillium chermesinum]